MMPRARWDWVESPSRSSFLIEHDLFGKPDSTFPDNALGNSPVNKVTLQSIEKCNSSAASQSLKCVGPIEAHRVRAKRGPVGAIRRYMWRDGGLLLRLQPALRAGCATTLELARHNACRPRRVTIAVGSGRPRNL